MILFVKRIQVFVSFLVCVAFLFSSFWPTRRVVIMVSRRSEDVRDTRQTVIMEMRPPAGGADDNLDPWLLSFTPGGDFVTWGGPHLEGNCSTKNKERLRCGNMRQEWTFCKGWQESKSLLKVFSFLVRSSELGACSAYSGDEGLNAHNFLLLDSP